MANKRDLQEKYGADTGELQKTYRWKIQGKFRHNTGGKQASISIGAVPVPPEALQVSWASRLVCSDICGTV